MARTPLLSALRCLFRDASLARASGLSLEAFREVRARHVERARARGISRRAFLASAGVATAATVIPRRRYHPRASKFPTLEQVLCLPIDGTPIAH